MIGMSTEGSEQKWWHHRLSPSLGLCGCLVTVNRLEILHRSEGPLPAHLYHWMHCSEGLGWARTGHCHISN